MVHGGSADPLKLHAKLGEGHRVTLIFLGQMHSFHQILKSVCVPEHIKRLVKDRDFLLDNSVLPEVPLAVEFLVGHM